MNNFKELELLKAIRETIFETSAPRSNRWLASWPSYLTDIYTTGRKLPKRTETTKPTCYVGLVIPSVLIASALNALFKAFLLRSQNRITVIFDCFRYSSRDLVETTSNSVCTQYTSRDCTRYWLLNYLFKTRTWAKIKSVLFL